MTNFTTLINPTELRKVYKFFKKDKSQDEENNLGKDKPEAIKSETKKNIQDEDQKEE